LNKIGKIGNDKMRNFPKVVLAALILLIVCAFFATDVLTPDSKSSKAYSSGENTPKSPTSNSGSDSGSLTYRNVNPELFNCMKQKLATVGAQIPQGNEGDIEGRGVKVHFKWDGVSNLALSVKDKPWYISQETITGKIHDFVIECGGGGD
jgi:hypothetical protein